MALIAGGSVMKAMMRRSPPHCGQSQGKSSSMRASRSAQAIRAVAARGGGAAALAGTAIGGGAGGLLTRPRAVTCARCGELGASTPW